MSLPELSKNLFGFVLVGGWGLCYDLQLNAA